MIPDMIDLIFFFPFPSSLLIASLFFSYLFCPVVSPFENCVYVCWNLYESTRMVHHEGESESARKIYKIYPTDHFRRLYKLIGSAFIFLFLGFFLFGRIGYTSLQSKYSMLLDLVSVQSRSGI